VHSLSPFCSVCLVSCFRPQTCSALPYIYPALHSCIIVPHLLQYSPPSKLSNLKSQISNLAEPPSVVTTTTLADLQQPTQSHWEYFTMNGCYCSNYYGSIGCRNTVSKFGERCKLCVALKSGASLSHGLLSDDDLWMVNNESSRPMAPKRNDSWRSSGRTTGGSTRMTYPQK